MQKRKHYTEVCEAKAEYLCILKVETKDSENDNRRQNNKQTPTKEEI